MFDHALERRLGAEATQILKNSQCVVARKPSRRPALPSSKAPAHTEVVQCEDLVRSSEPDDELVAGARSPGDDDDLGLLDVTQAVLGGQRQRVRVGALRTWLGGDEEDFHTGQAAEDLM